MDTFCSTMRICLPAMRPFGRRLAAFGDSCAERRNRWKRRQVGLLWMIDGRSRSVVADESRQYSRHVCEVRLLYPVASRTMELRYTTDGHSWAKTRVFQTGEIVPVVMGRNYYIQFIAPDNASPPSPRCFPRPSPSPQRDNLARPR